MSIRIVLPEGDSVKCRQGTKVYTESGTEITNIRRIEIDIQPNSILEATITVPISKIENLEGIEGIIISDPYPEEDEL